MKGVTSRVEGMSVAEEFSHGSVWVGGWRGSVQEICRGTCRCDRARRPSQTAVGLLHRPDAAWRAQERRADSGGDGAGAGGGAAPIAVALCQPGAVVGRKSAGQGTRDGAAGGGAPWADRALDHRRYGETEEGASFGRGGPAIRRPTGQAG